jgi:arylsulfatase A-like enzyme
MKKKPNIIVICTDQQRVDTLSCYGSDFVKTPGFDKIADDGLKFDNAYCPSATCTPSRVSLLTGQNVSKHNVWSVGVNTGDGISMLPHRLGDMGYQTGLIGKAHLEAYQAPPEQSQESVEGFEKGYGDWLGPYYGFNHVRLALGHVNYGMTGHYGAWLRETFSEAEIEDFKKLIPVTNQRSFGGEAYFSKLPLRYHNSVWTTDSAIDFLDEVNAEDPFFLFVSYQDPHHPHAIPEDCEPSVSADDVPLPHYVEGELEDKPPHFKIARQGELSQSRFTGTKYPMAGQGEGADFRDVEPHTAAQGRAHYYSMIGIIDKELQRLWTELEDRNLYDDTLIIVTSDHGELLGDHGLWMKGPFHYEQLVKVPLIMKLPKGHECSKIDTNQTVSLIDVTPTCLSIAGKAELPDEIDGIDLTSSSKDQKRTVFVETIQDWHALNCTTAISGNMKMTWYANEDFGELIDLEDDPFEVKNKWDDEGARAVKMKLLSDILNMKVKATRSVKKRISYA